MPISALTLSETPKTSGPAIDRRLVRRPFLGSLPKIFSKARSGIFPVPVPAVFPRQRPKSRFESREARGSTRGEHPEEKSYPVSWVEELQRSRDGMLQALHFAEEVQKSFLPKRLPSMPGIGFGAALRPCHYLAGDFYNVARLDRDTLGIYLGDVMGHGPAAALLSVYAMQSLQLKSIEGSSYQILSPSKVLEDLNAKMIAAEFPGTPFVTMVYGTYDLSRRILTYCSGGHPPALLLRPGQADVPLACRSALLGVYDSAFVQEEVALLPGDRVIFYSDGFEMVSFGEHGKGVEALSGLLGLRDSRSPQELVDATMALVRTKDRSADDLTVVLMEVKEAE